MNQKDHKEIAKRINNVLLEIETDERNNLSLNISDTKYGKSVIKLLVDVLADYFEKEDRKYTENHWIFNKKQFLKDCGLPS